MNRSIVYSAISILMMGILSVRPAMAQPKENLTREVEVVKPYTPEVSDFSKINDLPDLSDTLKVQTQFDYSIRSSVAPTEFAPVSLSPVQLEPPVMPLNYRGYLKAGMGNYLSPLAEIYYHPANTKAYSLELFAQHNSSWGEIEMPDGNEVDADNSDTRAGITAKRFFTSSALYGDLNMRYSTWKYYGYNAEPGSVVTNPFTQHGLLPHIRIGYQSVGDKKFTYDLNLNYDYISDAFDNTESDAGLNLKLGSRWKSFDLGMTGNLRFISRGGFSQRDEVTGFQKIDQGSYFRVAPFMKVEREKYILRAGIILDYESFENGDNEIRVAPDVEMIWKALPGNVEIYGNLSGGVIPNTYRNLLEVNPYMYPGWMIPSTAETLHLGAGVRGSPFESKFHYNIKASLSIWENQIFWSHYGLYGSYFIPMMDDARSIDFGAEFMYRHSDRFSAVFQANYHHWMMDVLPEAWHRAPWDTELSLRYNARQKFYVTMDLLLNGPRKISPDYYLIAGESSGSTYQVSELKTIVDLNLKMEYRISDAFSIFVQGKNLLNRHDEIWGYYPTYGIRGLGGITLSF
ncbi:MAG: hypothetical protein PHS48_01050 [Bacteroidales bacterium]|nr:hypothetical protein [Bacteroidales bacterium]